MPNSRIGQPPMGRPDAAFEQMRAGAPPGSPFHGFTAADLRAAAQQMAGEHGVGQAAVPPRTTGTLYMDQGGVGHPAPQPRAAEATLPRAAGTMYMDRGGVGHPAPQGAGMPHGAAGAHPFAGMMPNPAAHPYQAYAQPPFGAYAQPPFGAYAQPPFGAYAQPPFGAYAQPPFGAYAQPPYAMPQAGSDMPGWARLAGIGLLSVGALMVGSHLLAGLAAFSRPMYSPFCGPFGLAGW